MKKIDCLGVNDKVSLDGPEQNFFWGEVEVVMNIAQLFQEQPFFSSLRDRGPTFANMIHHIASNPQFTEVIETGTARIQGNWGGDGQSTLLWDWVAAHLPNLKVTSIDIDEKGIEVARSQVRHVEFIAGDSLNVLARLDREKIRRVGLLYLDSYDWTEETAQESAFHHMAELTLVWSHLPKGCMIAIDDCHGPFVGKHVFVYMFMNKLGIRPAFTGYQVGWIKP